MIPQAEAIRRVCEDHAVLANEIAAVDDLTKPYLVNEGPLGDFCDSLHDLVAHVLMWDEISLAVLTDARNARTHWSLDQRWETSEAGLLLNQSGVAAGREVPTELLVHRYESVRAALLDELQSDGWNDDVKLELAQEHSVGSLAEYVMTVPNNPAFWHAAIHLGML
ncbi:hypothetical protein [Tenggerimyces flavus]|uniref:ClbS/DfsB family four-helix bundle protein n=1 Tax=Tenggerimyces flavus TaxID=1708749 RepID=A0ABV7YIW2_9ACTN|nr:hypothetical protein [Tenggerimyces flavus]MBM7784074.1 hypothetical protein [Tenggerimyces flavus]